MKFFPLPVKNICTFLPHKKNLPPRTWLVALRKGEKELQRWSAFLSFEDENVPRALDEIQNWVIILRMLHKHKARMEVLQSTHPGKHYSLRMSDTLFERVQAALESGDFAFAPEDLEVEIFPNSAN